MIDERELTVPPPVEIAAPRPGALAWTLAALVVGACVAVDPGGLVPTGPFRWTAITATTGLALALLVRRPVVVPRAITGIWLALLAALLLATLRAVDPLHAWIGTPDRRFGLLALVTLPALFLAGHASAHRSARRLVGDACTLAAIGLGAWTIAELVGRPPLGLEFADARAGGPFGQPAYLGAACLLVGPLAAATALDRTETRVRRVFGAIGSTGALLALVASQTRAAWVGAVVVAAVLATRGDVRRAARRHRVAVLVVGALVVGVALATPLGDRAASTFDAGHGTAGGRLGEWRVATRTIADHPVLGVGPEGYRVAFPREVDAAYMRRYGAAVYPDRAHNGVLDVALDGGLLTGALYLALLVLVLRHALRGLRGRDPVAIALGAAALGYVAQQQFLFPLAELDPVFWILVGLLVACTPHATSTLTLRLRALVVPIALATAVAVGFGAREVAADRMLRRAAHAGDASVALRDADEATRLRPDSIRTWYVAARIALRGGALTDVDAALDRVQQGLERSRRDPALRDLYGELLVERAARSRLPRDIALARAELARLAAVAPYDPRLENALVRARSLTEIGKP